jgi:leucyl-tRNA synthetase
VTRGANPTRRPSRTSAPSSPAREERYAPAEIEPLWQERWAADLLDLAAIDTERRKWFFLTMFPYTSGDLHIGHWYAEAPADAQARYRRMNGYNVLRPFGYDSFGLPTENAAIETGVHPRTWTEENIARMRSQLKTMGCMFDWSKELATYQPEYYRWNQWFFLRFLERGLAYRAKAPANWCPSCQTVLANEQVENGTCERCHSLVERRDLEQWMFRITAYADELLDTSQLQWPERILLMQHNWIGRSEGVEISFALDIPGVETQEVRVFTTRPDTVFGVTFMVLAPEHPLVAEITTPDRRPEVSDYVEQARRQSEIERLSTEREKTGVFTGAYCRNRLNGEDVPIYIADYALATYGTGAVMGVPAHDQRDFEYAQKYGLPVRVVIAPPGYDGSPLDAAYVEPGVMVASGPFDGLPSEEGKSAVADYLEERGWGRRAVSYRMRDWLVSRQRYWGTPIPVVYCERDGVVSVPDDQLPVLLPHMDAYRPSGSGRSPLANDPAFLHTSCPACGGPAERETDTMDTFVDSSWYYMRYPNPAYEAGPIDPEAGAYWLPVDQYTGGAEHATKHLLYARFFWKVCRDLGLVKGDEPFLRLFNQGIILAEDRQKMSKSRPAYVVTPDELVKEFGADTVRAFLMFIGPWELGGSWNSRGIHGVWRWLHRVWSLVTEEPTYGSMSADAVRDLRRRTHQTLKKVTEDLEGFHFNTMIAALMEYTNYLARMADLGSLDRDAWEEAMEKLLLMLAPSVPHLAEELWARTGRPYSVHGQPWPRYDAEMASAETFTLVVQVDGKLRDRIDLPVDVSEEEAKRQALASERVRPHIEGRDVRRVIYVPRRLVSIVTA